MAEVESNAFRGPGTLGDDPETEETNVAPDQEQEKEKKDVVQGPVTGIIYPPPSIRSIVDTTAQFVAKNGREFEAKIMGNMEAKSQNFSFLRPSDPYHAYYEFKIREALEESTAKKPAQAEETKQSEAKPEETPEKDDEAVDGKTESKAPVKGVSVKKAAVTSITARAARTMPKEAPPMEEFKMRHPELSALDSDIIKLTAQYTAVSGRQFLQGLAQREQRNPQFDFLKPTHALFGYFTTLVDGYSKLLRPTTAMKDTLAKAVDDRLTVLDRCLHRLEWNRMEEEKKKAAEAEQDAERVAYQQVDWHDFVVVETIVFNEEEETDLPDATAMGGAATDDMEMDMDMEEEEEEEEARPSGRGLGAGPAIAAGVRGGLEAAPEDEEESEKMKIVTDYTPQAVSRAAEARKSSAPQYMVDPSGRQIPIGQVQEHMRIELLDPRWREENQRRIEKQKETSYAADESIAENLSRFARKRADIFASSAEEEAQILREQEEEKRRAQEKAVLWDGHAETAADAKQAAREKPKAAPTREPAQKIGPGATQARGGPSRPSSGGFSSSAAGGRGGPVGSHSVPPSSSPMPPAPRRPAPPPVAPPGPFHASPSAFQPHPPAPRPPSSYEGPPGPRGGPGGPGGYAMPPPVPAPPMGMHAGYNSEGSSMNAAATEPPAKKLKTTGLVPEEEFVQQHPNPVKLRVLVPMDPNNAQWFLKGQSLDITISVKENVKAIKEKLQNILNGMPPNKQQLKVESLGYLKDSMTVAHYNLAGKEPLELSVRSRGGRR